MKKLYVYILVVIIFFIYILINNKNIESLEYTLIDFSLLTKEKMISHSNSSNIELIIEYEVNNELKEDSFISQSVSAGTNYKDKLKVIVKLSKREEVIDYSKYNVNELGLVPIMMYHGIHNLDNKDTNYIGGNVDKEGYNRTKEAFISDLEMYYNYGYRMIRLIDYIDGVIDVELGFSPIVLTFDDGNRNNINILGKDESGNIIIDPNSAVGILESFKKKYKDFNVTATFFLNGILFNQLEYNDDVIKWLVDNGYDIGNHTYNHINFTNVSGDVANREIATLYKKLSNIIKDKYVPIIALPYGSPYNRNHSNYKYIISSDYEGISYNTKGALRVGWEPNLSPFDKDFDPLFMKRVRAYDNNGTNFDIKMVFDILKTKRYISDGDKNKITVTDDSKLRDTELKVNKY